MTLTLELAIQILSFSGGLIGIWVTLNNKITRLEASQEDFKEKMTGFYSDQKELSGELKELNKNMQKMMVDLARISTFIEVTKDTKELKK